MAEEIFRQKVFARGLGEQFEIDSAGTYSGHAGELADPRMREAAHCRGYCLTHRSRPFRGETLPVLRQGARTDTSIKRRKMEKKIEALLKKCEKETAKYIKSHKLQIVALGKLLFEKKHLKSSEILSCIG